MSQAFKYLHWRRDIPLKEYLVPETLSQAIQMLDRLQGPSPDNSWGHGRDSGASQSPL